MDVGLVETKRHWGVFVLGNLQHTVSPQIYIHPCHDGGAVFRRLVMNTTRFVFNEQGALPVNGSLCTFVFCCFPESKMYNYWIVPSHKTVVECRMQHR